MPVPSVYFGTFGFVGTTIVAQVTPNQTTPVFTYDLTLILAITGRNENVEYKLCELQGQLTGQPIPVSASNLGPLLSSVPNSRGLETLEVSVSPFDVVLQSHPDGSFNGSLSVSPKAGDTFVEIAPIWTIGADDFELVDPPL